MRSVAQFRRVCRPLLMLFALVVLASPCRAVTMRVTVGFDGVQKMAVWTPIAVRLANPGEDSAEGDLLVSALDVGRTPMPVCAARVNLPAHSTKLYHAYVRIPNYGGKIRVALVRGYTTLAFRVVNVNAESEDDRLIVTVGDRSAKLSFLQGESLPTPPRRRSYYRSGGSGGATICVGSLAPDMLPDRPAAYEGVDVLVISGLAPESTNPNALKAICAWTASGGTLVVSTGADYRPYTNAFYDELLPVSIQGAADLAGLGALSALGRQAFPVTGVAVTRSAIKPGIGRALVSENGLPIVAERTYGAGRVVFLAFDHRSSPFRDWNGQTAFWKSIITGAQAEPLAPTSTTFAGDSYYSRGYYAQQQGTTELSDVVAQNPSIKTPSINTVGLFLLAYLIVLVPANYIVLRARRRLELAWLTTPAIVILFTIGAYAIGYTMKGGSLRLCEATLVEGSTNARYARVVTDASLFSPARRSYDLTVSDPSALSQIVVQGPGDDPPLAFVGDPSIIAGVGMAMWSSKTFEAVGGTDLGGAIQANLRQDGGEVRGEITNNTGVDLNGCVVVFGGAKTGIGRFAKGEVKQVRLAYGGSVGAGPVYPDPAAPLAHKLDEFATRAAMQSGSPALVGFAAPGGGTFDVPGYSPTAERSVCCVIHLNYEMGDTVVINPGMVKAWRPGSPGAPPSPSGTVGNGMLGGHVSWGNHFTGMYELPVPAGYKITSLSLVGSVNGNSNPGSGKGRVVVRVLNHRTGKWDTIGFPSAGSVPNPGDYISGNTVKVKCAAEGNRQSGFDVSVGVAAQAKRQ